jgi:nucleotide-binding universal stress UspA family protein
LRRAGEEWVEWARAQGVDAELRFDVGPGAISAETILSVAKETDARAIALFPEVAPTANAVFGAVAREVIRQADMPILALRMQ